MKVSCPSLSFDLTFEFGTNEKPTPVAPALGNVDHLRIELPFESRGNDPDEGRVELLLDHAMSPTSDDFVLTRLNELGVTATESCYYANQFGTRYAGSATLTFTVPYGRFYGTLVEDVRILLENFFRANLASQKRQKATV